MVRQGIYAEGLEGYVTGSLWRLVLTPEVLRTNLSGC